MGARDSPNQPLGSEIDRVGLLTEAQKACLRGVLAHLTSRQIARELGISPHTVDGHLRAAMQRLGVRNRTEAALLLAAVEDRFPQPLAREPVPARTNLGVAEAAVSIDSECFPDAPYTGTEVTYEEHERNIAYTSGHREQGLLVDWKETESPEPMVSVAHSSHRNERNAGERLLIILLVSFGSALMFAALVLGLSALSELQS